MLRIHKLKQIRLSLMLKVNTSCTHAERQITLTNNIFYEKKSRLRSITVDKGTKLYCEQFKNRHSKLPIFTSPRFDPAVVPPEQKIHCINIQSHSRHLHVVFFFVSQASEV